MGVNTRGRRRTIYDAVKESLFIKMVVFMMDYGKTTK
jgi:hypothetical protein